MLFESGIGLDINNMYGPPKSQNNFEKEHGITTVGNCMEFPKKIKNNLLTLYYNNPISRFTSKIIERVSKTYLHTCC